jgi:hypothetical protein
MEIIMQIIDFLWGVRKILKKRKATQQGLLEK